MLPHMCDKTLCNRCFYTDPHYAYNPYPDEVVSYVVV